MPFFGWVRDARGKAIPRATLSIPPAVVGGVDGEAVTIISDNLGHFKIPGLGKDVDPKKVLVECAKAGYRTLAMDRRILRNQCQRRRWKLTAKCRPECSSQLRLYCAKVFFAL